MTKLPHRDCPQLTSASSMSNGSLSTAITAPKDARLRLVLVDDHAILREGLRALLALESDLNVVGEADNGDDGVAIVEREQPDVVITDLAMSHRTGIQVISRVRKVAPAVRLLVLTVHNGEEYIKAALTAGPGPHCLEESSRAHLLQAIPA